MNFKKFFALLAVSTVLLESSVSAGSVRGVSKEDEIVGSSHKRHLKSDKNNVIRPVPAPVFVAPIPPPAPVAPPTPRGAAEWAQRCAVGTFTSCLAATSASFEGCTSCLYAQSRLSSTSDSGIISCGRFLCGGCTTEARAFYNCGARNTGVAPPVDTPIVEPVGAPVGVPVPVTPAPVRVPDYTYEGCPETASSGDSCTIPSPFKYQQCDYPNMNGVNMRCVCSTLSPLFLCNPAPATASIPVPVSAPVSAPAPVGVPVPATPDEPVPATGGGGSAPAPEPVPATGGGGSAPAPEPVPATGGGGSAPGPSTGVCSPTLPRSGDSCQTGGAPWVYCCYDVDIIDGNPAPPGAALVCSCLNSEGRYVCNLSGTAQCTTIIRPTSPSDPEPPSISDPEPVPDQVPAPVSAPEPVVIEPDPVPDPVSVPDPVVFEPVPRPNPAIPGNATSCEGVQPGSILGGERIFDNENGSPVKVLNVTCTCSTDSIWLCTDEVVGTAPGLSAAELCESIQSTQIPSNGDNCGSILGGNLLTSLQCMLMQSEFSDAVIDCGCNAEGLADPAAATWACDGTFPPFSAPTLMPAGQTQPVGVVPVPASGDPVQVECPPNESRPNDGDDCLGFLPEILMTAVQCDYDEITMDSELTTCYTKSCTCSRDPGVWSCTEISSISMNAPPDSDPEPVTDLMPDPVPDLMPDPVPAPVPDAVPAPAPEPESVTAQTFNEFTCRPVQGGCVAPHDIPSDCDGTPACCPGNILDDWRTGSPTCDHNN